jgi:hypothetical protein
MKCIYCKKNPPPGQYVCDECVAQMVAKAEAAEKLARSVKCRSCKQPAGAPCVTGSGAPRNYAHATREHDAKRVQG